MSVAWVGLGSNLGDSAAHIQAAIDEISTLAKTRCLRTSELYRSAPVGPQDQPDFCNAVAALETGLSAQALLENLLEIEQQHQRVRTRRWGPRSLDLDLLLYDDLMHNTPELQLPHPRMHVRAFVLAPMAELTPGLNIPGQGQVKTLLADITDQQISLWKQV